jgi:hypothetical protein
MLQRYNVNDQKMEKVPNQNHLKDIYFEAYRYSLELCENPEIARQVALLFLASVEKEAPASTAFGLAKA